MDAVIIDLAAYRAAMRPAVSRACHWHESAESILRSNIRICAAWQRVLLRAFWGI